MNVLALAAAALWLTVPNLHDDGANGIFDPSLTADGRGALWMSYSAVQPSPVEGTKLERISTRLAVSRDGGRTWRDTGAVNRSEPQKLPPPHDTLSAVWEHEVSRVLYDPYAPPNARWKLVWHRYLRVYPPGAPDSRGLFEHGWIAAKTAPSPNGPWSPERKLFTGLGYDAIDDGVIGPPEVLLDRLAGDLGRCAAFTEPGLLATREHVYVSLRCAPAPGSEGRVVLLACDHALRACTYRGTLLRDGEARAFGPDLATFSATDLVESRGRALLVVSPATGPPGDGYRGCLFFAFDSLDDARLRPQPVARIDDPDARFEGACGYVAGLVGGVFINEYVPARPNFRIRRTGLTP